VILISLLALGLMRAAWETFLSDGKTIATCHAETYPVAAVEFVKREKLAGPLFNNFNWGGYLIWNLRELPVSIDGRTNLYGEERLKRSMNTWNGTDWESDPELQRANVVIAPYNDRETPLTHHLRDSPKWRVASDDKKAIVFVRVKGP
jgi:hypothetical protein